MFISGIQSSTLSRHYFSVNRTHVLYRWPLTLCMTKTIPDPRALSYRTHRYGRCHIFCIRNFLCSHVLSFTVHTGVTQLSPDIFSPVVVFLNMPKIWHSGSDLWLSAVESNCFLASHGLWWLQRTPQFVGQMHIKSNCLDVCSRWTETRKHWP